MTETKKDAPKVKKEVKAPVAWRFNEAGERVNKAGKPLAADEAPGQQLPQEE